MHIVAGQRPARAALARDPQRPHPRRRDPQEPVQRSAHRPGDRAARCASWTRCHPVTRHISVAYWRGGDEAARTVALPAPEHREDRRVGRLRLDQARHPYTSSRGSSSSASTPSGASASSISAAVVDERQLTDAARRLATDIGQLNQNACTNARIVFVLGADSERMDEFALVPIAPCSPSRPRSAPRQKVGSTASCSPSSTPPVSGRLLRCHRRRSG